MIVSRLKRLARGKKCPAKVKEIAEAIERKGDVDEPYAVARSTYDKMKGKGPRGKGRWMPGWLKKKIAKAKGK